VADSARLDLYRQVAGLHARYLDQGFLATLGPGFLAQLYRAIDEGDSSVLICERQDGRVLGFVSGAWGMGPIYRRMLRRPFALGLVLLPSLMHPVRLWRILEVLRYGRGGHGLSSLPQAELLSIAVAADARGYGIADRLYSALAAHFRATGIDAFCITVGGALEPAHRFYRRMGAQPVGELEVHRGRVSTVYVHKLTDASHGAPDS
jgi:ribosomal protein S18 acetylase RimI-like enzyme